MCGINGFASIASIEKYADRIKNMNSSLVHRGPDTQNYKIYNEGKVVLGHCRLSIIDLDQRSNQPMSSASGEWAIVFNGEIYNYKELKEKTNYPYQTTSDTEVILAYIEQYGVEAFLRDCNGMFALCLYNTFKNYMILVRDRLGIKPLYFTSTEDKFIFSSEIKGILSSGLVDAELEESAIDEYLANRYIRAPYTFFRKIFQLEPGSWMRVDCKKGGFSSICKRYWTLPEEFNVEDTVEENTVLNEFESKLVKAVRLRMVADVPLGTYLSGGVDSSIVTAIAAKQLDGTFDTYTIGFPELNEFEYAEQVAKEYNTNHHQLLCNYSDYFEYLREVISFKDAPLGVPNEIPLALMSRELKKKITVVLSGEGADELLGGYGRIYRAPFDYENHIANQKSFFDYFMELYEYVPREIRDKYLLTSTNIRSEFDEKLRMAFQKNKNEENVFRYFHSYHVQGLLQRVDTTTMLASVEARVPFLDHELVEFSYQKIPYNLKLKWKSIQDREKAHSLFAGEYSERADVPKYLLKKLSYQYLPERVIERKKVGFPVPLEAWRTQIGELAKTILPNAPWLKEHMLDELLGRCRDFPRAGQIIWMLINVEIFRQMYFEKDWKY